MLYRRLLDPHLWESPSFNNLSRDARLLFIGLISSSDDEGYFRADSGALRRGIFGYDDITKEEVINLLKEIQSKINSIHFYKEKNEAFGHFINWNKWQTLRKDRLSASVFPKCTNCQPTVNQLSTNGCQTAPEDKVSKGKVREDKVSIPDNKYRESSLSVNSKKTVRTENQLKYDNLITFLESILQTKFTNYPKQATAIKKMFLAGYTENQIQIVIKKMSADDFYRDKGFDMTTVMNEIPRYKAKMRGRTT
jgi:hypothetical protein